MSDSTPDSVTALVVFRSASGRPAHGDDVITADTLADALPDPAEVADVAAVFRDLGFVVGPPMGIAMSITADRAHVESVFGVDLVRRSDGAWALGGEEARARPGGSADDIELPTAALPERATRAVAAVVIEPPVELFGELTS